MNGGYPCGAVPAADVVVSVRSCVHALPPGPRSIRCGGSKPFVALCKAFAMRRAHRAGDSRPRVERSRGGWQ